MLMMEFKIEELSKLDYSLNNSYYRAKDDELNSQIFERKSSEKI